MFLMLNDADIDEINLKLAKICIFSLKIPKKS